MTARDEQQVTRHRGGHARQPDDREGSVVAPLPGPAELAGKDKALIARVEEFLDGSDRLGAFVVALFPAEVRGLIEIIRRRDARVRELEEAVSDALGACDDE